jgi:hypothetical protein
MKKMENMYFYVRLNALPVTGCHVWADCLLKKELKKLNSNSLVIERQKDFEFENVLDDELMDDTEEIEIIKNQFLKNFENDVFKVLKINKVELH